VTGASAISAIADTLQPVVVAVQDGLRGGGAGVIWRADGLILTNDHVVQGDEALITFHDGTQATAKLVARDPVNDLAALQVERTGLPTAPVGDSRALRTGELVIAIGHPLGVARAVSAGIVGAQPHPAAQRQLITADIYLNRGNSGGPLANARGEVIGINAMVMTPGIGLAVPSHVAQEFVRNAFSARHYIGIAVQPVVVPEEMRQALELSVETALIVTQVESGSPAERGGLLPGDLLIGVAGQALDEPQRLLDAIALAGEMLALTIVRGGVRLELITPVEERARAAAA
jgi:serine protease Do